jgi:hypothetical protein
MKTLDEQFIDWESEVFGYGYGTGEQHTLKALKEFMDLIEIDGSYDYQAIEKQLGATITWLMINILCKADILDYGTSPRFGWLTEKGKLLKKYLAEKTTDELYDLTADKDENYIGCGKTYCNCDSPKNFERKCINNIYF